MSSGRPFRVLGGVALVAPADWATAQQAPPPPSELLTGVSEVTVTAQRLDENVQRATISVTPIGGEVTTQRSTTTISDLTQFDGDLSIEGGNKNLRNVAGATAYTANGMFYG